MVTWFWLQILVLAVFTLGQVLISESQFPHLEYGKAVGMASLIALLVKNLPAMQEMPVQFLGQEDPLEKGWTTHFSILGLPLWLSW